MLRFKRLYSSSTSVISNYLNCRINFFLSNQITSLPYLHQSHAYILTTGHTDNIFIASKLISLYAFFNNPNASTKVFDSVKCKDPFLWNSIIKAHFSNGLFSQAYDFYTQMRVFDILPNQFTIPMVVSLCGELGLIVCGMSVHGLVSKLNLFDSNAAAGSAFVYMYAKCRCLNDARDVFDEMSVRDVVSWTALVIGYVQNGDCEKGLELVREMHRVGSCEERPNFRTLEGGFQGCGKLGAVVEGRCLHGMAVKSGIICCRVVQSSVFWMYSKCGNCEESYRTFCEVPDKDLMAWTSIVGVYSKSGRISECVGLFSEMLGAGIYPDGMFISCMLSGFGKSMNAFEGKAFHGFIIRANYDNEKMVYSALLSMYCKFGLVVCAEKLFDRMQKTDKEMWNVMLLAYAKAGLAHNCIQLFREMLRVGIEFDSDTLVAVISSFTELGAARQCRSLHCCVIKDSMHKNVSVANALIDMYGKVGHLAKARRIFCRTQKDTVTWNTLISSHAYSGHYTDSLSLYDQMVLEGLKPSAATLIIVLSACSHIASLEKGEQIHHYIKDERLELTLPLATALVDMYAKCGQIEKSRDTFNSMKQKDVVSWNVMISGYGMHGDARSAIELLQQMEKSDIRPNELTFLAILIACTHAGLVEEGKSFFARMSEYSLKPTLKHYSCMVDLLGRSGNLHEAEALALSMPIAADGGLWGALLSSCKIHNNPEMGIRTAGRAIECDPDNDGYYVIISDLYSSLGMCDEAEKMRTIMQNRGVKKAAGWSVTQ